jgi:hypothetical protein
MFRRRSVSFAAVGARLCVPTVDMRIFMPDPSQRFEELTPPFELTAYQGMWGESRIGLVDVVEIRGREILLYGRITAPYLQDIYVSELHARNRMIVADLVPIDAENCRNGLQHVWTWTLGGFIVTRYPPWHDLPRPRLSS